MFCIRFTKQEGCDITASPRELRLVGETITRLASFGGGSHSFSAEVSVSPKPYDQLLSFLTINVTTGPVCARVELDTLSISAGPEFLIPFASFFNFDDETPSGHHVHHEYWEGNTYITPNSTPMVIGIDSGIHGA